MRDQQIRTIIDGLMILESIVQGRGRARMLDIHEVSEDFFAEFLNTLWGWNLTNLNKQTPNHPAIDLGDTHKRVGIQVTSLKSWAKVNKTIEKFEGEKPGLYKIYDRLIVLVISKKQGQYSKVKSTKFSFDPKSDIIDTSDLIKEVKAASSITNLKNLEKLIQDEGLVLDKRTRANEEAELSTILSYFDRNAFRHSWGDEGSTMAFEQALDDLTELLTTGRVKGVSVTLAAKDFKNPIHAKQLRDLKTSLSKLRAKFNRLKNKGIIDRSDPDLSFLDLAVVAEMDAAKQDVLKQANIIGQSINYPSIVMHS